MPARRLMLQEGMSLVQAELTKAVQDVAVEQLSNVETGTSSLRHAVVARVQRLLREPNLVKGLERIVEGKLIDFGQKLVERPNQHMGTVGNIEPKEPGIEQILMGIVRREAQKMLDAQEGDGDENIERIRLMHMRVSELGLSTRAMHCLEYEEIETVSDLIECTSDQLLKVRNLGEITLDEIEGKLAEVGLKLRNRSGYKP